MAKTKKEALLIKQRIQEMRGIRERERRRKFLYLKNTGQLAHYYAQKAGIKVIEKTIKPLENYTMKESWLRKLINLIKLCLAGISKWCQKKIK